MSFNVHPVSSVEDGLLGPDGRIKFGIVIIPVTIMDTIVAGPKQMLSKYSLNEMS